MRRSVAKLKGIGFILWHARHEFYHVLLGLMWAWFLRELWQEFNTRWIAISIIGSLLPDLDHFFYFFIYGKKDTYAKQVKSLFKNRQWRALTKFLETGHKHQTSLATHNLYFVILLFLTSIGSFFYNFRTGVVVFGAMITHYLFDMFDDFMMLGYLNINWMRWGRPSQLN